MANDECHNLEDGKMYEFCLLKIDTVDSTGLLSRYARDIVATAITDIFALYADNAKRHCGMNWSRQGDGALYAFHHARTSTMVERAAKCSIGIIDSLRIYNNKKSAIEEHIRVRVAIHVCTLLYSSNTGTIVDDGLSFVCNLEKIATSPDSISISDDAYKALPPDLRQRFCTLKTFQDKKIWSPGVARYGEAYILLEVIPGTSDQVVTKLSGLGTDSVPYAAAVWGPWDVVARVTKDSFDDLLNFIDQIRNTISSVRRTETWCIRNDQPHFETSISIGRLAFIMLTIDSSQQSPATILSNIRSTAEDDKIKINHVAGVLGPYDIAATVRYDDEDELKHIVMEYFQKNRAVKHTLTMPSITGMVHPPPNNYDDYEAADVIPTLTMYRLQSAPTLT